MDWVMCESRIWIEEEEEKERKKENEQTRQGKRMSTP